MPVTGGFFLLFLYWKILNWHRTKTIFSLKPGKGECKWLPLVLYKHSVCNGQPWIGSLTPRDQRKWYLILAMTDWLPVECSRQGIAPLLSSKSYCRGVAGFPEDCRPCNCHIQSAVACIWITDWDVDKAWIKTSECVSARRRFHKPSGCLITPGSHTSACHVFKRTQTVQWPAGSIFQLPLNVSQFSQCHGSISYGPMSWPLRFPFSK